MFPLKRLTRELARTVRCVDRASRTLSTRAGPQSQEALARLLARRALLQAELTIRIAQIGGIPSGRLGNA